MRCETTSSVKECALRARSTHGVHHAIVEVNIVIGVVLGEVLVARVVPLVVDAVIGLALSLIAHVIVVVFVVAILHRIFLYGRDTLYSLCTFEIEGPTRHSSNEICPSMTRNELFCPYSLLLRSHFSCFWYSSAAMQEVSSVLPPLTAAAFASGIFIA